MGPKKTRTKTAAAPAAASTPTTEQTPSTGEERIEGPSISGIAETPVPATSAPAATKPTVEKEKIVVTLDNRGGLDIDAMRPKTKEKLVEALKRSATGLFPTAPAAPMKRWPEAAIRGTYGILSVAKVAIAARKYPPEFAAIFAYNDKQIEMLMEPTQAVLARYAGTIKHEELIALGMVLVQIEIQNVYAVNQALARYEARKASEAPPAADKKPESDAQPDGVEGFLPKVQ